jgi:cytochrome c oxidase subunit 4
VSQTADAVLPSPADEGHEHVAHIMPAPMLLAVFAALIALTAVTLAVSWFNLGDWNLAIAIGIATVKASLVVLYFMHLRYDNPFYALIFVTALVFLGLLLSLNLMDAVQCAPNLDWK